MVNLLGGDYHLAAGSQNIDQWIPLATYAMAQPPDMQYAEPHTGVKRPVNGAAADLGAYEV
jgi:hypothetical protein